MSHQPISFEEQFKKIASFLDGFNATWIIATGSKYGILQAICDSKNGISVTNLAERLKYNQSTVKEWCRAAYCLGVLDMDKEGVYKLAPHIESILVDDGSLSYLAGFFWYAVAASREYNRFKELLEKGKTVGLDERSDEYVEGHAEGGKSTYNFFINVVIPQIEGLQEQLVRGAKILEIGCGWGLGMIYLKERFKNSNIVGIDIDRRAIEIAQRKIEETGIKKDFIAKLADAKNLDLGERFDLIYMTFTLHETGNPKLVVKNCQKILNPGGYLVILDVPYPEPQEIKFRTPPSITATCLQFGELVQGTPLLSLTQIEQTLHEARFADIKKIKVHDLLYAIYSRKK